MRRAAARGEGGPSARGYLSGADLGRLTVLLIREALAHVGQVVGQVVGLLGKVLDLPLVLFAGALRLIGRQGLVDVELLAQLRTLSLDGVELGIESRQALLEDVREIAHDGLVSRNGVAHEGAWLVGVLRAGYRASVGLRPNQPNPIPGVLLLPIMSRAAIQPSHLDLLSLYGDTCAKSRPTGHLFIVGRRIPQGAPNLHVTALQYAVEPVIALSRRQCRSDTDLELANARHHAESRLPRVDRLPCHDHGQPT